jgi:hypothetical protein
MLHTRVSYFRETGIMASLYLAGNFPDDIGYSSSAETLVAIAFSCVKFTGSEREWEE